MARRGNVPYLKLGTGVHRPASAPSVVRSMAELAALTGLPRQTLASRLRAHGGPAPEYFAGNHSRGYYCLKKFKAWWNTHFAQEKEL